MPEVRPLVPKTIDHPFFFSHLLMERPDEEEYGQGGWNTVLGNTAFAAPLNSFNLITGATVATLDSSLKSFVTVLGNTAFAAPLDSFNLITGAAAATQGSILKSFVYEDTATEFLTIEKNENQVADLIWNIQGTPSIPDRDIIAKRLFELLQDVKEEGIENTGISIGSLRSFYNFLQTHSNLKKPSIALTPVNDIYVSWRAEGGFVFSIHFLSTGFVRFAIIAPNPHAAEQPVRISGSASAENLVEKVKPWGILKWAGREGR